MQPIALELTQPAPWWKCCRWTLGLCAAMAVCNLGLFPGTPPIFERLIELLQFDRRAILDGQIWRLLTGNLVHWSREHFLLDVGAFAVMGLLYERHLGRHYPWVLLVCALAVGGGMLVFLPEMSIYRGLSGVDSGQFAAAVCVEFYLARRDVRRWLWVGPAAAVFLLKIVSECATGQMFFGTESLGNIGNPTPLAHAAGTAAAVVFLLTELHTHPRISADLIALCAVHRINAWGFRRGSTSRTWEAELPGVAFPSWSLETREREK